MPVYRNSDDLMLKMLMGTLTVDVYQIYRKTPKTWTKKALTEVMTYDFVKETIFTDGDITNIVPALTNLMEFLGKNDLLDQNKTDKYIRFFEEIQPEMLKQIHKDASANLYKMISEETVKRQLDINDQERVHEFGETFFAEGGFEGLKKYLDKSDRKSTDRAIDDFLSRNSYETNDEEAVDEPELLNDPKQLRKAAKNYETDAERQYLNNDHILKYGNHFWNMEEAKRYHDQGLELGLKLYLKRRQYGLNEDISKSDVIDTVVQMVDFFYAYYLTGPQKWQTRNMLEVGGSFRSHTSDEGMSILKNLIRMMRNDHITTFEHADALIDALLGQSSSVGSVGFSKGKLRRKKKKKKKKRK
ncbi:hypothetical protein [Companilactobacillus furfuricola]|uniref:hypothetical protein n=1 Tax=Companilactobacillus furfuricola TaxID=1462575 RepID=UPI0013DDF347|nr:hypothetical protein [Companilactobacillus furfuricola]